MLENRGPHMVENDYTPLSALDIFVKDLVRLTFLLLGSVLFRKSLRHHNLVQGIVSREGYSRKVPLHVSNAAHQLFLSGTPEEVIFIYLFNYHIL